MTESQHAEMRAVAQRVAAIAKLMDRCNQRLVVLGAEVATPETRNPIANLMGSASRSPADLYERPIIDMLALTVTWRGRNCFLGNGYAIKLLDRLACRPGHYLSIDRLVRDVWRQPICDDTFRSTVRGLRRRLRKGRMVRLADAIRASGRCYALSLDGDS